MELNEAFNTILRAALVDLAQTTYALLAAERVAFAHARNEDQEASFRADFLHAAFRSSAAFEKISKLCRLVNDPHDKFVFLTFHKSQVITLTAAVALRMRHATGDELQRLEPLYEALREKTRD